MITIIIILLVCWFSWGMLECDLTLGIIAFVFGSMAGFLIVGFISCTFETIEISRRDIIIPISSLNNKINNKIGIQGNFVLGSGSISDVEYYYTFKKNKSGGFERLKLKSNDCIIYQDAPENPHIFYQVITKRLNYWIYPGKFTLNEETKYDLHVPENTIVEKFKIE